MKTVVTILLVSLFATTIALASGLGINSRVPASGRTAVAGRVAATGRVAVTGRLDYAGWPTDLSVQALYQAELGIVPGTTPVATGTTPPAMTITWAAPAVNTAGELSQPPIGLCVKPDLGGSRGTATIKWSVDNCTTFVATGVLTAATVALSGAASGVTLNFPTGTYNTDNQWAATVVTWDEAHGLALNLTNATAAKQPIYVVNCLNGRPCLRFASARSTSLSVTSNLVGAGAYTMGMAVKFAATGTQVIWGDSESGGGMHFRSNGGSRGDSHIGIVTFNDGAVQSTRQETWVARFTPGVIPSFYVNGVLTSWTGSSTTLTSPGASAKIAVGGFSSGGTFSSFSDSDIVEAFIASTDYGDANAIRVSNIMKTSVGL